MKDTRLAIAVVVVLLVGVFFVLRPWGGGAPPVQGSQKTTNAQEGAIAPVIQASSGSQEAKKSHPAEAQPIAKTESTGAFQRQELAAAFGVTDHGPLSEDAKSIIVDRINRELAGVLKNLENTDPNADPEAMWRATISIVKYQESLALIQHGEYLTVDATALPKNAVTGYDPMIMLSAANLDDGTRVGVLFPVSMKPGSELDQMGKLANDASAQRIAMVVTTFNAQSAETRSARIRDMLDARNQLEDAVRQQQRGEITPQEFARRMGELNSRLPPNGVRVDGNNNTLHR